MITRRNVVAVWTTPIVLGVVLPPHAQASPGGLRWVFELTVTEGISTISFGGTTETEALTSAFTRTLSFRLTPEEITSGSFVRERGGFAADYERFEVTIDARTSTSLGGSFDYISFDAPFSFAGSGVFTARCA